MNMNISTGFCMDVVQVKSGGDKFDTFVKILQQIVRVTAPIAYSVAAKYPNVLVLVRGIGREGSGAVEDLKVRMLTLVNVSICFGALISVMFHY